MIISLSGKKQSGKDTVAKIIQYIVNEYEKHGQLVQSFEDFLTYGDISYKWQTKQWSAKLKAIVCLLLSCTMDQLEDNVFKEIVLGKEWWHYQFKNTVLPLHQKGMFLSGDIVPYSKNYEWAKNCKLIKFTPRLLLQYIGTDCGRDIIHPNIWINALMSDYKGYTENYMTITNMNYREAYQNKCKSCDTYFLGYKRQPRCQTCIEKDGPMYPNWIITDTRFPNELAATGKHDGFAIRINRKFANKAKDRHESETALDDHKFENVINNDGTIDDLIQSVKEILITNKIIT